MLISAWRGSQLIESVTVPTDEVESTRRTQCQRREKGAGPPLGPSLDAVAAFRRTGFYRELMALCVLARDLRDGLARTREDDHELWVMCESAHTLGDRLGRFWNRDQGELACEFRDAGVARDPVTDEYPPGVERLIELAELRAFPSVPWHWACTSSSGWSRRSTGPARASAKWEERDALILAELVRRAVSRRDRAGTRRGVSRRGRGRVAGAGRRRPVRLMSHVCPAPTTARGADRLPIRPTEPPLRGHTVKTIKRPTGELKYEEFTRRFWAKWEPGAKS